MKLIVGLGNPTEEYSETYHNMGFMAVDKLAEKLNKSIKKAECNALTSTFQRNGEKLVLAKPLTYMNLSGQAVSSLMAKYKAKPEDVIIIFDDFDLSRFALRARYEGSGGSHNGMKNVIAAVGSQQIKRIRIGIGAKECMAKDYVLSRMQKEDKDAFSVTFDALADILIEYMDKGDFDAVIRECAETNKKK